jgi:P-type Mg2+ transporter
MVGRRLRLPFVYKLALAKLFVDQALPSAGVSGTVVVAQVLERSELGREAVLAGIVVNTTSFFIAYTGAIAVALAICYQFGRANAVIVMSSLLFTALSTGLAAGMLALTGKEPTQRLRSLYRYRVIRNALSVVKDADPRLVHNLHLQVVASLYQLITFLLDALTLWSLIRSVGANADISYVFASFMIANLVRTISFIPGGLGTFEGAVVLMLKAGGTSVAAALSAALLFRGLTFFVPMVPGLWFSRLMTKGVRRPAA